MSTFATQLEETSKELVPAEDKQNREIEKFVQERNAKYKEYITKLYDEISNSKESQEKLKQQLKRVESSGNTLKLLDEQQKKVNQKKSLLNMIKNELDQRNASIKHLNNTLNELEKKAKLPQVAKNLEEFQREKERLVKKHDFEKYQQESLKRMLNYRKSLLETYYKPISDLNLKIDKEQRRHDNLNDEYNKLKKDYNDLEKDCKDLEQDEKQRYEFCRAQIALESRVWQDEIMFTELMKNENTYIKKNVLHFLEDMAKLEKDNNDHIQSLKNKVEGEKRENMRQKEEYQKNLGELKKVIAVKDIEEVHSNYEEIKKIKHKLDRDQNAMEEDNLDKQEMLKTIHKEIEVVQNLTTEDTDQMSDDEFAKKLEEARTAIGDHRANSLNMSHEFKQTLEAYENYKGKNPESALVYFAARLNKLEKQEKLEKKNKEIEKFEGPLDKVLTCVSRMQNLLRNDGKAAELTKEDLCTKLNEVSLKATSLYDQLFLSQADLHDSMIIEDQVKLNENDIGLDFKDNYYYDDEGEKAFKEEIKNYKKSQGISLMEVDKDDKRFHVERKPRNN